MMEQLAGVKRSHQRMLDQDGYPLGMDGVAYHDFSSQGYYTHTPPPPPPQATLFSNPFSPHGEYVSEGYIPNSEAFFAASARSYSDPFVQGANESFGSSSSASSSCGVSIGPATPPPPQSFGPATTKFPAVPITPSHIVPRQKAKRTATACEECRKRKQKCDGESPCQSCKEQKLDCKYREVSPTKKDNSMERLVNLVEAFSKSMEALNQRLDTMSRTLGQIERRLTRCFHCGTTVELETGVCSNCTHTSCRA